MTVDEYESIEHSGTKRKYGMQTQNEPLSMLIKKETSEELQAAIEKLPPDQKNVIIKVYLKEQRAVDYAGENEISEVAVSQRIQRAIKNLKKFLKTR